MISSSITAWVSDLFACIGSCFGCRMKPTPIIAVDEPTKGLRIQGQKVRKPTISDGFWSSSTCDLDNNAVQSQRSITSVSTLNQLFYHSSELSPTGTHPEFVNQGLLLWNESRFQWVGSNRSKKQNKQQQEPQLNWNATYDSLLGTKQPFPRPLPLSSLTGERLLSIPVNRWLKNQTQVCLLIVISKGQEPFLVLKG
ncbi:uncharacterized protein LOC129319851 isoform X2 [Prosopis cineraria]|uniref:uncharacterized protein LOC129319851 isoform X2 n=1 Tax=Prosopis cineraria TaxID=364024 RepID=UPI0024102504|nr:uncharacterized protein LOC129319851 isoform X2 [Prosopis cineraria]